MHGRLYLQESRCVKFEPRFLVQLDRQSGKGATCAPAQHKTWNGFRIIEERLRNAAHLQNLSAASARI